MRIDESGTTRIALTIGKKINEDRAEATSAAKGGGVDLSGMTSKNMLASNFFDQDYRQSKYATGLLDSLKVENSFDTKLQSLVQQGGLISPGDMDNYAKRILAADKAANKVEDVVEERVSDEVGDEVEKNTDAMEEAVDEKLSAEQDLTAQVPANTAEASQVPADAAEADAAESPSDDETDAALPPEVPVIEAAAQEGQPQALTEAEPVAAAEAQADVQPGERIDMII